MNSLTATDVLDSGVNREVPAVQVRGLSRTFRSHHALQDVDLTIPRGSVFGLVGVNGAGKTTLVRHLMGALAPQSGSVQILGQNPITDRERVLRRVGYLTEEDSLPKWASVGEVLDFFQGIQPNWDDAYARHLCEMFRVSRSAKLSGLSKGQRARVGLLVAIAHRPELLILDEPSSGLDPIARGDILEAIIRTVNEEGRTVLFSSHLLDEVDRVCDHVALIHEGRLVETISIERLQDRYQEIVWYDAGMAPTSEERQLAFPEAFGWQKSGKEWSAVVATDQVGDSTATQCDRRPITLMRWFAANVSQLEQSAPQPVSPEVAHHV